MKLETKTDPFPHVIVTEMFTDEELAAVRLELEYLSDYQALVELHDGTFANRLNLYDFFVDGDDSAIGRLVNDKVFSVEVLGSCLLYTSPSPRDQRGSRMPSSA